MYKMRDAEGQWYATRRHGDPVLEPANKIMTTPGRFVQRCVVRIAAAYIIIIFFVFNVKCVCVCVICYMVIIATTGIAVCNKTTLSVPIYIIYTYSNLYNTFLHVYNIPRFRFLYCYNL